MIRLLLVEDNPANEKLARLALTCEGFDVVSVADGPAALAALVDQAFDVVLLDIQLPSMNGLEVLERIRVQPRLQALPVLAVTAYAMGTDRERFLAAGFADCITKPIDVDTFADRVRAALT